MKNYLLNHFSGFLCRFYAVVDITLVVTVQVLREVLPSLFSRLHVPLRSEFTV
jgi:hypothetical protein